MSNAVNILTRQLPDYFKPIIEFQNILNAQGHALDILNRNAEQVRDNNYISTADERTIAFWENILGLTYLYGDTLDYRRAKILQEFTTMPPFSVEFLQDRLTQLYEEDGYELLIDPTECSVNIKVTSDRYGAIDLLYTLLWNIIPAHIQIYANQITTNYIGGAKLYAGGFITTTFIQTIGGEDGQV